MSVVFKYHLLKTIRMMKNNVLHSWGASAGNSSDHIKIEGDAETQPTFRFLLQKIQHTLYF